MNNVILKNSNGLYFVSGSGFTASCPKKATRLDADEAASLIDQAANFGFEATEEEAPVSVSFAVCYIRPGDRNEDGSIKANALNPSRRRFASFAGAATHGRRFNVRKSSYGAAPGSAGHIGFYVIETNDPVNSAINLETGLTVPTNGAPKTYDERRAAGVASEADEVSSN